MFTAKSDGERIMKIGQHLVELWARIKCPVCMYFILRHPEYEV